MDGLQLDSAERLQVAALEAFADRGYHGTTTREIAARAGLSATGVYLHHDSKADLLDLVVTTAHETLLSDLRAAADQQFDSAAGRLKALVAAHVRFHASHQAMACVANNELRALNEDARRRVLKLRESIEAIIQEAVESCCADGSGAADKVRLSVFAILTASIGLARWYREGGVLSTEDFVDRYSDILLRIVFAPTSGVKKHQVSRRYQRSAVQPS